jgi:membrane protein insertase Oxa1/YidC/SpoIIIJ
MIPEALQQVSLWGGSGILLKTFHAGGVPYWGGFAATNVLLRVSLSPLVLYSARTAARFAKVAPEIQFLVTLFQNDMKKQRQEGATLTEQRSLMFKTLQTISGIYQLHKINPFSVFLSPFLQIPFFMYMSIDLRKIINGADPELSQQLTEGGILWFKDLTEPDMWYTLPILGGVLLYYNVEVAIGKQALSGEMAAKSNVAGYLKDFFQSLAVFMPCFMSQSPAGIQIYLIASFVFTYFQGQALRSDKFRGLVGLPMKKGAPKAEAKYAEEFIALKKLERKAIELRGDGEVLGKGVLVAGLQASFAGSDRPTTIEGSGIEYVSETIDTKAPHMNVAPPVPVGNHPFIHGISAPPKEFDADTVDYSDPDEAREIAEQQQEAEVMVEPTELEMERANNGQLPIEIVRPTRDDDKPLSMKKFKKKATSKRKKK